MERSLRATGRTGRRRVDRPWRCTLAVCLLFTTTFLVASFDLHPHSDLEGPFPDGLPMFSAATHPEQAPHVESAGQVSNPRCPACLLQLHDHVESTPGPFSAALTAPSGLTRKAPPRAADSGQVHAGGSRAPPTA